MRKSSFYLNLGILNLGLFLSVIVSVFIFFASIYFPSTGFFVNSYFLIGLFVKIFFLQVLFGIVEKKFPDSGLSKLAESIKISVSSRKYALISSLIFDVIMVCCILVKSGSFISVIIYLILTLGGVSLFYISLFMVWMFQGKLK
ncbi:hypothetical protein IJE86_01240 [bacterium]|nr:hypothetical protein [bacterium]